MADGEEPMDIEEGYAASFHHPAPSVSMEDGCCHDEEMRSIPDDGANNDCLFDASKIQSDEEKGKNDLLFFTNPVKWESL